MDAAVRYAGAIVSLAKEEKKLSEYKLAISELDAFFLNNAEAIMTLQGNS